MDPRDLGGLTDGGSSAEETFEAGIRAARKLSMDGTRAIYDLTSGIDFSKPRRTAEAIARVAWQQDVESWWTWEGTEPVFKPNRTVEIRLPRDPDRKVARAAAEFQADLKEEFAPSIDSYLYSLNDERGLVQHLLPRTSLDLHPPARGEPSETTRGTRSPLRRDGGLHRGRAAVAGLSAPWWRPQIYTQSPCSWSYKTGRRDGRGTRRPGKGPPPILRTGPREARCARRRRPRDHGRPGPRRPSRH